jgi:hypothetical protein
MQYQDACNNIFKDLRRKWTVQKFLKKLRNLTVTKMQQPNSFVEEW